MPKGRLEAFSDGVIAIVITLLVLEIHVPDLSRVHPNREVVEALRPLLPGLIVYAISFLVCAVWWVSHHNLVQDLVHVDRPLLWANNLFLLWLAVLPLPTALLSRAPRQPLVCALYGVVGLLTGASFAFLRWYASSPGKLMRPEISLDQAKRRVRRSLLSPTLYFVGFVGSWVDPRLGIAIYGAIPLYFASAT